ncbi:MAG: multidrug ABC transporter ATP-binding protein [Thermoprotei archaeon]|nr:MAG: multidrug ABC transporter ATP-binding protein [Thermoprotei archaeon]
MKVSFVEEAVSVERLVKAYGRVVAVDKLTFKVNRGEVFGLIGPNGAGKTTTLRVLATLIKPTAGQVEIYGLDVVQEAGKVRKLISYLPEEAGAYNNLTGLEFLRYMASLSLIGDVEEAVSRAAELSGLENRLKDKIKTYSKGMKRRLLVARALMVRPKLAILDEPTSGLDVVSASQVRDMIKRYVAETKTAAVISSHNMLEVEYLCDRVLIINEGRSLVEGPPQELKERFQASNLEEVFMAAVRKA